MIDLTNKVTDPQLPDRDLLLILLYQVTRLNADVQVIREFLFEKEGITVERKRELVGATDKAVFAELEANMRLWEQQRWDSRTPP